MIPKDEKSGQQVDLPKKKPERKSESARDVMMVPKDGREGDTVVEVTIATTIGSAAIADTGVEVVTEMLARTRMKIDPGRDAEIGTEIGAGNTVIDAIAMAIEGKTAKETIDDAEMEAESAAARDLEIDAGAVPVLGLIAETKGEIVGFRTQQKI